MREVRTSQGKLIGMLDEESKTFQIKEGNKIMAIAVPLSGIELRCHYGSKLSEKICIQFPKSPHSR